MRTFNEFVQAKEYAPLAEALVLSGVNVDQFCEQFLVLAEETNWSDEESINELWRGLGALFGAGASAAGRGAQAVGSAADRAISTVGQTGIEAGKALGGAVKRGAEAVGGAVKRGAEAVGTTVKRGAEAVGGAVQAGAHALTDIYQSAEHQGRVRDTMAKLANMKAQLQKVGVHGADVDASFDKFQKDLIDNLNKLAADKAMRVGPGGVQHARLGTA